MPQFNDVVVENRETLDSFAVITSELRTLEQNLESSAIELEDKLKEKLREEEEIKELEIARAEARAAYEAEIARKVEPLSQEETKKSISTTDSSAQTNTLITEQKEERVVQETITSAVTTKEIRILQKVSLKLIPSDL